MFACIYSFPGDTLYNIQIVNNFIHIFFFFFFNAGFGENVIEHPLFEFLQKTTRLIWELQSCYTIATYWPTALETNGLLESTGKQNSISPHACQNQLSAISTAKVTDWSTLSGAMESIPLLSGTANKNNHWEYLLYWRKTIDFWASYFTPQIVPVKGGNAMQWTGFLIFRDVAKSPSTGRCLFKSENSNGIT